jgi:hypothetical protein
MSYRDRNYSPRERKAEALDAEAQALLAALRAELPPEQADRVASVVRLVEDASSERTMDLEDRLIEGLVAHLPAFAPTIRALALHLLPVDSDDRCFDACSHPWPATGQHWGGEVATPIESPVTSRYIAPAASVAGGGVSIPRILIAPSVLTGRAQRL